MPCYTVVQVEVKNKEMAEAALKQMGVEATITKSGNMFVVTPKVQTSDFRDTFLQEYGVAVATKKAKLEGYFVSRAEENGEVHLTLRSY